MASDSPAVTGVAALGYRSVPFFLLDAVHAPLREELVAELTRVVDSNNFILGPDVALLEREISEYTGVPYAVGCASGSDAILLSLVALGVGPGDKVITTPFTFFATAGSISHAGATPVFADIDPHTFNLHPDAVEAALARHPDAKAVIAVHLFGGCADMDPLAAICSRYGCRLIEDGAQAIGAEYRGRRALGIGDAGCLSFFPSKNLGAMGEAGMVLTPHADIREKAAALRVHGSRQRYFHDSIGFNSRLDTLQAAILRVKLRHLDDWTEARRNNAALYFELLAGVEPITLPRPAVYQSRHVFNQFVIRAPERDRLRQFLTSHGVGSEIYYPLNLHQQVCYQDLGYRAGDFPEAERSAAEVLALPVRPGLAAADVRHTAECIRYFYTAGNSNV